MIIPVVTQIMLIDNKDMSYIEDVVMNAAKCSGDSILGFSEGIQNVYAARINGLIEDVVNLGYW